MNAVASDRKKAAAKPAKAASKSKPTAPKKAPSAVAADSSVGSSCSQGSHSWWHPATAVSQVARTTKGIEKQLARQPLARMTLAWPRTARFVVGELLGEDVEGVPSARLTPALVGQVAMDESIMAIALGPNRFPRRSDYQRVSAELARARSLFADNGWIDNPVSFHQDPPPLTDVAKTRGWALGKSYERIWWPSGYEPHVGVPGTDRWLAFDANRTASAWILRHKDGPRPWVICVHGLGTGSTFMDLISFRASHLHEKLGVNVAAIVLPVHGARRPNRMSGDEFLGFEFMNSVHGLTQALWDTRRLVSWVRQQDPTGLGIFGVSLGGLVSALVAAVDPDLDMVLSGIPIVDFPGLIEHHAPRHLQLRSIETAILDGTAQDVHSVVSPLKMDVLAPKPSLAIFGGLGDRLATTDQAHRLWRHWDKPDSCWFQGNHVGYLWSDTVWKFVDESLIKRGLHVPR